MVTLERLVTTSNRKTFEELRTLIVSECYLNRFKVRKMAMAFRQNTIIYDVVVEEMFMNTTFPVIITIREPEKRKPVVSVTIDYHIEKRDESKAPRSLVSRLFNIGDEFSDATPPLTIDLTDRADDQALQLLQKTVIVALRDVLNETTRRMRNRKAAAAA